MMRKEGSTMPAPTTPLSDDGLSRAVASALDYLADAQLVYATAAKAKANLPFYDSTVVGEDARNLYKDCHADAEEVLAKATAGLAQAARLVSELAAALGRRYANRTGGRT
jgi:ribosomal protein L17